jgi:hypothetical protein
MSDRRLGNCSALRSHAAAKPSRYAVWLSFAVVLAAGASSPTPARAEVSSPPTTLPDRSTPGPRQFSGAAGKPQTQLDRAEAKKKLEAHGLTDISSLRLEGVWRATALKNGTTVEVQLMPDGKIRTFRE